MHAADAGGQNEVPYLSVSGVSVFQKVLKHLNIAAATLKEECFSVSAVSGVSGVSLAG